MTVRLPGTPLSWLDKEIAKAEEETFSLQCSEARKSGLYQFYVAAELIARAAGSFVNVRKIRDRLEFAAKDRSLPAYQIMQTVRWDGDMPMLSCLEIHWDDLNKWLENNEPRIDYKFPKPEGSATPAAKVKQGITKGAVINAFEGVYFNRDQWGKALGKNIPDWLITCRVTPGKQGRRTSATWNPVLIAAALFDKKITTNKLNTVFIRLKDWDEEWRETSSLFRD